MENLNIDIELEDFTNQKEKLIRLLHILEDKEVKTYEQLEYPMGNWESINIIDNIVNDYMEDLKKKYKMIKRL